MGLGLYEIGVGRALGMEIFSWHHLVYNSKSIYSICCQNKQCGAFV
jgi:hypothetical protein